MQKLAQKIFTSIGAIFVILAVLILIDALHLIPGPWGAHLGLTFFFLVILVLCLRFRLSFLSTLFASFIVMLHKAGLGMAHVSNWTILGIAILLGIGISLLYHPYVGYIRRLIQGDEPALFTTSELSNDTDSETIYSRFSQTTRDINGEIENVNINTNFSDLTLHFNNAVIPTPTATLNFSVKSSTLTLYIPLEWEIQDQLNKIGSSVKFNGPSQGTGTTTLYLTGSLKASKLNIIRV